MKVTHSQAWQRLKDQRLSIAAIILGFTLGFCAHPAPADEVQDQIDRQWDRYQQDSERYRDRLEAEQRQQERANACYLAGENSAMCRAYGDPYRRRDVDRRNKY